VSATFITGSGTDVGKTFITAALILEFRRRGKTVHALKPIMSGFDPTQRNESDAGVLLTALGETPTQPAIDRISPLQFSAPLSPDMAARREGRTVDFDALLEFSRAAIADQPDILFIEGVGGVMVPLDAGHTVLDWMSALHIPVLLVGGSYLGAISHALTALDALKKRDLTVKAVLVNETVGSDVDLAETVATIERFAAATPVIGWPRLPRVDIDHPALQRLADLL
jgi:dethiobiotin synthetase